MPHTPVGEREGVRLERGGAREGVRCLERLLVRENVRCLELLLAKENVRCLERLLVREGVRCLEPRGPRAGLAPAGASSGLSRLSVALRRTCGAALRGGHPGRTGVSCFSERHTAMAALWVRIMGRVVARSTDLCRQPPWRQPSGKSMVPLVNSHSHATSRR